MDEELERRQAQQATDLEALRAYTGGQRATPDTTREINQTDPFAQAPIEMPEIFGREALMAPEQASLNLGQQPQIGDPMQQQMAETIARPWEGEIAQEEISGYSPEAVQLALQNGEVSPEMRSYLAQQGGALAAQNRSREPNSDLAQIHRDIELGFLTPEQGEQAVEMLEAEQAWRGDN